MLRDFGDFLRALWREWKALLTGGSVIAALALWQMSTGRSVARRMNWLIVGLTLMLASFFAWRREWIHGGHGLVSLSPKQLTDLFDGRTQTHANLYAKQYIGKRIRVTGEIYDVSTITFFVCLLHLKADGAWITAPMGPWKARSLAPLAKGTIITVAGRIAKLSRSTIELGSVELIRIEDDHLQPEASQN